MSENLGTIEYIIKADTAQLLMADKEVAKATDNMQDGFDAADEAAQSLSSSLGELSKIAAAVMAVLSVNQVSKYADAWTELNNKLTNALRPNEDLVDVTERVFNITQQTRSSLDATASLYSRLERATRQYGTSAEDLAKLTSIINQGFIVSGASAEEAENAIIQLSQGLASGALRGEEFNSVNEQGNRLIVALADSLGVTIGQMRQLAADGKLTTDVVVNGLLSQGTTIGAEFAKTTTTISQAMQVAGNNITKFIGESTSVKTGVAIFNDAIITASDNISGLSLALTAVAALMGSRYVGALTMAASAQVRSTVAKIADAKAAAATASAAEAQAAAQLRSAQASKSAATSELNLAQARLNTLKATGAASVEEVRLAAAESQTIRTQLAQINSEKALETQRLRAQITEQGRIQTATRMAQLQQASATLTARLAAAESAVSQSRAAAIASAEAQVSAARMALADATGVATAANGRYIASQEASAVASRAASTAATLAKGALSLIGGPAGAAMIAAGAIFYFWQKAQQAREEAISFADGVDKLNASLKSMSNTQLRGTIADANIAFKGQTDAVQDLKDEIKDLTAERDRAQKAGEVYGTTIEQGNGLLKRAADLTDRINQKQRDLESLEQKAARTKQLLADATTQVTNNMLSSMGVHDKLIEKGSTLERVQGAVARAFGSTADEINRANQAGKNFNPKALQVSPPTEDGDKVILNLQEQNELLKIQDDRLRAVTKAGMEAAKATSNPNQIESARRLAGENYDLQQAEDARKKAQQDSEQQDKRSASQLEANLQKIADYKQRADTATNATQELSREQALLRAEQSLNKSATADQIAEIRRYAAAEWDAANAVKKRQQAEQGRKFAQQEMVAAKIMPDAESGAIADPTAQIDFQEQQKLAALSKYQALDIQNAQLYEDAKTAIQQQAANERKKIAVDEANVQNAAIGSILSSASQGFDSLATVIQNASGKSSGAYVAMFAAAKAFAIAQSTLSLNTAIMQAMADPTALTPAQKLANYAAIASAGASLLSNIASTTMSGGRRYGGTVSAGNAYRINESGESEIFQTSGGKQAFIPNQSGKVIPADKVGGGGVQNVYFTINTTGGISDAEWAQIEAKAVSISKKMALYQISDQANRPGGIIQRRKNG